MVIWFSGISGSGKTTIGKKFFKFLKGKSNSTIYIDGDGFRKIFKNDLGYSLKERNINAYRLTRLIKDISDQKINIVVSANLTSPSYRQWCKKNIKDYHDIHIKAKKETLIKRDYKNLYKNIFKKKIKNIVGVDIPYISPKSSFMYINNDKSKTEYYLNIKKIFSKLKKSKVKFY